MPRRTTSKCWCTHCSSATPVIVLGDLTDETASVVTVNCNEMDAATLLLAADNFFNYINMREAPPKEAMN